MSDFEFLDGPDTGFIVRRADSAEAKPVSPRDLDNLSILADDADATGEEPPHELVEDLGELVLSVLPVSGEVLSARDAYLAAVAARRARDDGDLAAALEKGGISAVHALGSLPWRRRGRPQCPRRRQGSADPGKVAAARKTVDRRDGGDGRAGWHDRQQTLVREMV